MYVRVDNAVYSTTKATSGIYPEVAVEFHEQPTTIKSKDTYTVTESELGLEELPSGAVPFTLDELIHQLGGKDLEFTLIEDTIEDENENESAESEPEIVSGE